MFRRIESLARQTGAGRIALEFEGQSVQAFEGQMLAIALLESGVTVFRQTPVSGAARGPLCLMGVCFECLVEIDGRPNQQACMVVVREGMQVRRQAGARA